MSEYENALNDTIRLAKKLGIKQIQNEEGEWIYPCKKCGEAISVRVMKQTRGLCNKCYLTRLGVRE